MEMIFRSFLPLLLFLVACEMDTSYDLTYDFLNNFSNGTIIPDTAIFDTPTKKPVLFLKNWEIGGVKRDALIVLADAQIQFNVPAKRQGDRLYFGAGARFNAGDGVGGLIIVETRNTRDTIFYRFFNPASLPEHRAWFDFVIPLFNYRSQDIKVIFAAEPGPNGDYSADWFSWSEPKISY